MVMHRAIILHGMPSKQGYYNSQRDSQSNAHWLPWLQQQLCVKNILTQTPEMPLPYAPSYEAWVKEFERQEIDELTTLIGHSCGAGFLIRWLSGNTRTVRKVVLVAPWLDRERDYEDLFSFKIDPNVAAKTTHGIDVLYSTNDDIPMQETLEFLRRELTDSVRYHEFKDYGHFCFNDMNTREFPKLLEICLNENN